MKRIVLVAVGAIAGIAVVMATNFERFRIRNETSTTEAVYVAKSEDGDAVAILDKPADPGQRREIAETMKQISTMDDSQWTKRFTLRGSDGKELKSEDLKGQPYVANFFFSTCPATCKQQTEQVRLLQDKYKDRPIRFVSISVDPEVDTPETLSVYATAAGAIPEKWLFLTGDMKMIAKIGGEMFLIGGMKRRFHPDRLCLVNAEGVLVGKYNWHEVEEVKALNTHIDELLGTVNSSDTQPATVSKEGG